MATPGFGPVPISKLRPIKILKDNTAVPARLEANVGDTVEFHNEADTPKIITFVVDQNNAEYYPLGFVLQPKSVTGVAALFATPEDTIKYKVASLGFNGGVPENMPDDDPYVIVVGSGNRRHEK